VNDLSEAPKLYARQGEAVVCVRAQHVVCHMARDVYVGAQRGNIFTDWRQPEPDRKLSIHKIRCVHCRAAWVRKAKGPDGRPCVQLHFAEGWR